MGKYKNSGFTIIEVMIVLSITGLMLVGFMISASVQVNTQQEKDAVQDLASFLQEQVSETLYPQYSGGTPSNNQVVWGRMLILRKGTNFIEAYPLTGSPDADPLDFGSFRPTIQVNGKVVYEPKWQSELAVSRNLRGNKGRDNQVNVEIYIIRNARASEILYVNIDMGAGTSIGTIPPFEDGDTRNVGSRNSANFIGLCIGLRNSWTTIAFSQTANVEGGLPTSGGITGTDIVRILNRDTGGANVCQNAL